jgi:MFS family permease
MVSIAVNASADTPAQRKHDWQIIGLVGAAHACSHFFQLVFPTLFLSLAHEYGYDFAQLGLLVSTFFLVSCLGQASSGFVVDRIGPTPVLRFGLAGFVAAGLLIAFSNGYAMLLLAAFIGGLGNSVFHPVDFSIMNHRVSPQRLGHAFSTHGFTGYLGWALTPVFMAFLIQAFNWRVAAMGAATLVAIVLFLTWLGRSLLAGKNDQHEAPQVSMAEPHDQADLSQKTIWQTLQVLLAKPALWGAFLFFAFTAASLSAIQNYTIPMLGSVYGVNKVLAGTTLSAYMVTAAGGMLFGGFLVGANARTERIVAGSLFMAGAILVVLATGVVGAWPAMVLVALAGLMSGVAAPSRDMLIRRVTPKGATGTVYGLVYSGMDVGSSLAPVAFGLMLDSGWQVGPWYAASFCFVAGAVMALWVAVAAVRQSPGSRPATA